jgi:hypothetical protein
MPLVDNGEPTVIYIFNTKCAACEQQYGMIASELAMLPRGAVITGSIEPQGVTADYWKRSGKALPTPVVFRPESLRQYGLKYTPTLLILDADRILLTGLIGADPELSPGRLARVLEAALR